MYVVCKVKFFASSSSRHLVVVELKNQTYILGGGFLLPCRVYMEERRGREEGSEAQNNYVNIVNRCFPLAAVATSSSPFATSAA